VEVQPLKKLYIIWLDAVWCKEEPVDLCEMHTIGFLIAETDSKVIVASEYSGYDDKFRYYISIPKPIIRKMVILEENGSAEAKVET